MARSNLSSNALKVSVLEWSEWASRQMRLVQGNLELHTYLFVIFLIATSSLNAVMDPKYTEAKPPCPIFMLVQRRPESQGRSAMIMLLNKIQAPAGPGTFYIAKFPLFFGLGQFLPLIMLSKRYDRAFCRKR